MRFVKASAFAVSLVAAMAVGVWIGPHITHHDATVAHAPEVAARTARAERSTAGAASHRPALPPRAAAVSVEAPELHARVKPLLNKGADTKVAAQGFRSAEQFATVAHAARNTDVPFMVLKHRVLDERKSLAAAIRESRPDLNAAIEADRARAEARSDLAALAG